MDLSIVIVNWNASLFLVKCLRSIYAGNHSRAFEVIVVDNASTDASVGMVRDQFPQVKLILNSENAGFAQGNNLGFRHSSGEYLLMLNPDTEIGPGTLDTLVRFLEAHPEAGAAGARLVNSDGSPQVSCYRFPSLANEFWRLFHLDTLRQLSGYQTDRWGGADARPVDVVKGACLILRRQAMDQVGGLDESFFMYSEEVDLCRRLLDAGWLTYWVPQTHVIHHEGQSTRLMAEEMFLNLYQSKLQYFHKHGGDRGYTLYKWLLAAASLTRLLLSPFALVAGGERRRRTFTQARRYRNLLISLPSL